VSAAASPLHDPLIAWYQVARRPLPWRGTREFWPIWVSEVMLQQTRVETVLRHWGPFLARFPGPRDLAEASEEAVRAQWSGLGYYRRARALQEGARAVVERHGGVLPRDPAAVRALPGVGPYTAGALLSLVYGLPEPLVDGNVARVLARIFLVEGDPARGPARRRLWDLAATHLQREDPATWNQALMELGALHCRPRNPGCPTCPVVSHCEASRRGRQDELPFPSQRAAVRDVLRVSLALVRSDGAVLLRQRPGEGLLASLWELPAVELRPEDDGGSALRALLPAWGARSCARAGEVEHLFTHRRWRTQVHREDVPQDHPAGVGRWFRREEWGGIGLPTAVRRELEVALGRDGQAGLGIAGGDTVEPPRYSAEPPPTRSPC
jgi:A/G-specific adenine glycosylase